MAKLRASECRPFIDAVAVKSRELGAPVSIAFVGPEGHLICLERMDDAGFITAEIAWSKAFTACAFRAMSPRFPDGLAIQKWTEARNPQMMVNAAVFTGGRIAISGGCAPNFRGDEMVGAYGISGGTSDQDEVMAVHARGVCGWRHMPETDTTPQHLKDHIHELYSRVPGLENRKL
jgi:glc operon protein GlcG